MKHLTQSFNPEKAVCFFRKKEIPIREYNKRYRDKSSYHFIKADNKMVTIGFLTLNEKAGDILTNEELYYIDRQRRASNIRPFPLD